MVKKHVLRELGKDLIKLAIGIIAMALTAVAIIAITIVDGIFFTVKMAFEIFKSVYDDVNHERSEL